MREEKVKSFQDLIVWQKADKLFYDVVEDVKDFPRNRISFIITDQIVRSVSSISSNIAEATGTRTGKDFEHFLIIARREVVESENWYIKTKNLNWISVEKFNQRINQCEEIRVMLNGLIGSSRRKRSRELES